jgi:hypothetical protein
LSLKTRVPKISAALAGFDDARPSVVDQSRMLLAASESAEDPMVGGHPFVRCARRDRAASMATDLCASACNPATDTMHADRREMSDHLAFLTFTLISNNQHM